MEISGPSTYVGDIWSRLKSATIGWDRSRRRSGSCSGGKKELTRDQGMLMIFGPRPMSVGEVWSGPVLVQFFGWDRCQLRVSMPRLRSQEGYGLVDT